MYFLKIDHDLSDVRFQILDPVGSVTELLHLCYRELSCDTIATVPSLFFSHIALIVDDEYFIKSSPYNSVATKVANVGYPICGSVLVGQIDGEDFLPIPLSEIYRIMGVFK